MKSKLPNHEELSIRYVLNDLDPSEEVVIERLMGEDENVLIEVESLRNTYRKLGNLPTINAPARLLDTIVEESASRATGKPKVTPVFNLRNLSYAAAASILIAGGVIWQLNSGNYGLPMVMDEGVEETTNHEQYSSPWIDRRDIMHVSTFGVGSELVPDSVLNRLRPIDGETSLPQVPRQVQLTGTQP